MLKIKKISRKQRRRWKRKVVAAMCVSLFTSNYAVYGKSIATQTGKEYMTIGQNAQVKAAMISGNEEIPEGEYQEIEVSQIEVNDDNIRKYTVTKDGVYLFTGSNYDEEQDIFIPTQVQVSSGVKATIYFKDLSIINKDGKGFNGPAPSFGPAPEQKPATTPMIIENDSNVTIKLLSNTTLQINQNGTTFLVDEGATVTLEESEYQLNILDESDRWNDAETYPMYLYGTFVMNGSHLLIKGNQGNNGISLTNDPFGENLTGQIFINGGYFDFNYMRLFYKTNESTHFIVHGGQFNSSSTDESGAISNCHGNLPHNIVEIKGLEKNSEITLFQQYYKAGDEKTEYNTTQMKTDDNGKVYVDLGVHNAVKDSLEDITGIIKCGEKYYELSYCGDRWDNYLQATEVEAQNVYKINFYSIDKGEPLDSIYTTVDESGKAKYHYQEDKAQAKNLYYLSKDGSGEEYDFKLTSAETNVYVMKETQQYSVTINDGEPQTLYYGESVENTDQYIFIDSEHHYWDGIVTKDITVQAYPCTTIDNKKYVTIDSKEALEQFANEVNQGVTDLKGYLTSDINAGNFKGIGTSENRYRGEFLGDHHTIELEIEESKGTQGRALFHYITSGCVIREVCTTGTIDTNGKYASGLVGEAIFDGGDQCQIERCRSNVKITYTPGGKAECGGLVGKASEDWNTNNLNFYLKDCLFNGTMQSGNLEKPLTNQGGLIGSAESGRMTINVSNCYVNATFDATKKEEAGDNIVCCDLASYRVLLSDTYYKTNIKTSRYGGKEFDESKEGLDELGWKLNQKRNSDDVIQNSEIWSYDKAAGLVYADGTHKPVYRVEFVDEGVYEGKEKLAPIYKYTNSDNNKITPALIPDGFLKNGHKAYWMLDGKKCEDDIVVTKDTKATLSIEDENTYSIEVKGDYKGSFTEVEYGTKLSELCKDSNEYLFIGDDGNYYTKVDGLCTEFTAYQLSQINERTTLLISNQEELKAFAAAVNGGYTNLDAILQGDIDISSIQDFHIGENSNYAYNGIFDGNGHTLKINLVEKEKATATGVFRYVSSGAVFQNLTVTGNIQSAANYVGGIVGYYTRDQHAGLTVKNCKSAVNIETTDSNHSYVGGMIGYASDDATILLCNYTGIMHAAGETAHCSGILGYMPMYHGYTAKGCYVHMNVNGSAKNEGRNFTYQELGEEDVNEKIGECYYDVDQGLEQGDYTEKITGEIIYKMNSVTREGWNIAMIPYSYYDSNTHCMMYEDETHARPYEITLEDPGVYSNKKCKVQYAYTNADGTPELPELKDFLYEGHEAHWYLNDVEVDGATKIKSNCTFRLKIKSNVTYDITITGDDSKTLSGCKYGDTLPDGYYYLTEDNRRVEIVDGTFTSVKAYAITTIGEVEYLTINSAERMKVFRDWVNAGNDKLNGYVTSDFTLDNSFGMIGSGDNDQMERGYCGIFDGNGHTITMNLTEEDGTFARALFSYLGKGAIIRNVITTGTIVSNGKYCGGIAGDVWGDCTIENCGSDIDFTFTPGDDCTYGGMIGRIQEGTVTLKNCYFTGSFAKGKDGKELDGQGGLVGWKNDGLNASNCWVDATFEGSGGQTLCRSINPNSETFENCYYVTACGSSEQGNQISKENLQNIKFAYNLNTTNGTSDNSCVWSYVEGDEYPCFATDTKKAICQVKFTDPNPFYEKAFDTTYELTNINGTVKLPDLSGYLEEGDIGTWYCGENQLTEDTVISNNCDAILKVEYSKDKALIKLQEAYEAIIPESSYTTASYNNYQEVRASIGKFLSIEDKSLYSGTQIMEYIEQIKKAKADLVIANGSISLSVDDGLTSEFKGRYANGDEVTIQAPAVIPGHKFEGWYLNGENVASSNVYTFAFNASTQNQEDAYIAKYTEAVTYQVSFDGALGIGSMNAEVVVEGSDFPLPTNEFSAPDGMKFICWEIESPDGSTIQKKPGETYTVSQDITVCAVWKESYSVVVEGGTGSGSYLEGERVEITAVKPSEEVKFKCWTVSGSAIAVENATSETTSFIMPAEAVTVQAEFESIHKFGDWVITKAATCTEEGCKERVCSECGHKEIVTIAIDPNNHVETEVRNAKAATCKDTGYTGDTYCKACGKELSHGVEVPVSETHTYDKGIVTKEPTSSTKGELTKTCVVCGKTIIEEIPATGYSGNGSTVTEQQKDDKKKEDSTVKEQQKDDKEKEDPTVNKQQKGAEVVDSATGVTTKIVNTQKKTVEFVKTVNATETKIIIPNTVNVNGVAYKITSIAPNTFTNNKKITSIKLGSNITSIGKDTFSGCKKLETVTLGSKVTTIGANAFKGCTSLKKISLPSKCTKIGSNAFSGCKNLEVLYIKSTKLTSKSISSNAFKGLTTATTIMVPKSKVEAYKKLFKQKGLSSEVVAKVKGY